MTLAMVSPGWGGSPGSSGIVGFTGLQTGDLIPTETQGHIYRLQGADSVSESVYSRLQLVC